MIEEDKKTLWCGNLPEQVTEELLYELFLQAGPLEKVRIPKDRDGRQKNFAFVTYCHSVSVPYALKLFRGTALFHKTLTLQSRGPMEYLPPPIRCYGPEKPVDIQINTKQFADITEDNHKQMMKQNLESNKLIMASLQGNWTHRHHPYRAKDSKTNSWDDFRSRDNHNSGYKEKNHGHHKHSNNWHGRKNHKRGNNYHRRD